MSEYSRKAFIPQGITLTGIFFGLLSILWAEALPYWACTAIVGAGFCDLIDGRVARFTGTTSEFGAELDSLADIVSFGLAPAILVYHYGLAGASTGRGFDPWVLVPFVFVCCGAIRLARFNIGTGGTSPGIDFSGVPIPVAALLLTSLVMASVELQLHVVTEPVFMAPFVVVVALLMVAPFRMRSFKQFRRRWGKWLFFGAIGFGFLILALGMAAGAVLFCCLVLYVLMGLAQTFLGASGQEMDA